MGKLTAYLLMIIGVVIIALPIIPGTKEIIAKLSIQSFWIMILGLIILALGFVFMKPGTGKSKQSQEEVPIYRGNKIVGYRKEK